MTQYVIAGGKEGKERLKLLSEVLRPTTSQLLSTVGIEKGMKCLDVGCGGGFVTALMADLVGADGEAVGIDSDEVILDLARTDARDCGRNNIDFIQCAASDQHRSDYYDLVYARFLLTHVPDSQACLNSMVSNCKSGGLVVAEDIDFTGAFSYPICDAYQRYCNLYQQVVHKRGGDADIGPKLPGMFKAAGLDDVHFKVVQLVHIEGDGKLLASITMQRIAASLIAERLASESEINEIVEGLNVAAEDSHTLLSLPRIFQVWGKRRSQ